MRHDEISPKVYRVETHLKRSKIDSFSFVHCFVLQRRRCGNIYKVIDNHCPGHARHHNSQPTCFMSELSANLPEWLDTGPHVPDILCAVSCLYPISLHKATLIALTCPYLAAVWRRHLSPSLLASLSLSRVFSTSHRTVSCRPNWNREKSLKSDLLFGPKTSWSTCFDAWSVSIRWLYKASLRCHGKRMNN